MVIVASGVIMIIMGLFGKIGAIFSTIPTPVIGGMLLVMFGVIAAVGVSNLQVGKDFIEKSLAKMTNTNNFVDLFIVHRYELFS